MNLNLINLTEKQCRRFEHQISYARRNGVALYNSQAPTEITHGDAAIVDGDDNNTEDQALLAEGLLHRDDGYYTFTQTGWDFARYLKS